MDTKDAVRKGTQLRAKLAAKRREQHVNAVTALFDMGTTLTVGAPGDHCKLHCKRMDEKAARVIDTDVPVTLWNISKQKLVTDNLPEDHEFRANPPRVALIEVEDAKGVHWTLAGRINRLAEGERPIFACNETETSKLVLDLPESAETFEAWCKAVMSAGVDFGPMGLAPEEAPTDDDDDAAEDVDSFECIAEFEDEKEAMA